MAMWGCTSDSFVGKEDLLFKLLISEQTIINGECCVQNVSIHSLESTSAALVYLNSTIVGDVGSLITTAGRIRIERAKFTFGQSILIEPSSSSSSNSSSSPRSPSPPPLPPPPQPPPPSPPPPPPSSSSTKNLNEFQKPPSLTPFVPSSSLKSSTVSTTIPSRLSKPSASAAPSAFSSPLVTLSQVPVSSSKKTPLSPSLSLSPFLSLSPSAAKRRSTTPPPTSSANTYRPVPQTVPVASTSPRPVFSSTVSSSSSSSSLSSVPSTSFFSQEHSVFSPQTAEIDELHNSSKPAAFSIVHSDDSSKGQTLQQSSSPSPSSSSSSSSLPSSTSLSLNQPPH
ncbi:uncharacterized protein MONOS_7915 [Monocercomonoides exilis]|uniref:uncharacterized protein n=1 Tax=Monocercomonoides exilis TaxID=2049356 RepID=UPI0035595E18|nr:hypothetical protein MONOS_7915 [Monocercomonoides exilis]|eukprot:MONOS_7915.1-p1 / transcript=MONOS_7915.1 / gene=MONOS_7915 / organism=Monocercomonoides_exilis_PA203 / gene_product=unspecified product / transcript_product=unspecified product / location=Mono_scaffold00284:61274-63039(+) / protein_length=339 / sequence_SO=supercontig / SO=protein_coding / is_pseudo=false